MDHESQNQKDARVEKLWKSLHGKSTNGEELDLQGLRDGLRSINHRELVTCGDLAIKTRDSANLVLIGNDSASKCR